MINPKCNKCKKSLNKFGAILLGPKSKRGYSKKVHICVDCFEIICKIKHKCNHDLNKLSGIMLSPPNKRDFVKVISICVKCFDIM